MSTKQYYVYNEQTGTYDAVRSYRRRWRNILWMMVGTALLVCVMLVMVLMFFGSPQDEMLKMENEHLKTQYSILSRRVDDAMVVLEDIEMRDDNLYRVIMQADPIGAKVRNAGVDNAARYAELLQQPNGALVSSLTRDIDRLSRHLYIQDNSFNELVDLAHQQEDKLKCIPAIQPIADKDLERVGSGFGWRVDPVFKTRRFHEGIDLGADTGAPIYATGNAVVKFTGWKQGYGNTIDIEHGYGYVTRYAHLHEIEVVEGQRVQRGERIGQVGSTGKSTGPHLHYEVIYRGEPIDPINYFFMDLTPEEYDAMIQEVANQ